MFFAVRFTEAAYSFYHTLSSLSRTFLIFFFTVFLLFSQKQLLHFIKSFWFRQVFFSLCCFRIFIKNYSATIASLYSGSKTAVCKFLQQQRLIWYYILFQMSTSFLIFLSNDSPNMITFPLSAKMEKSYTCIMIFYFNWQRKRQIMSKVSRETARK